MDRPDRDESVRDFMTHTASARESNSAGEPAPATKNGPATKNVPAGEPAPATKDTPPARQRPSVATRKRVRDAAHRRPSRRHLIPRSRVGRVVAAVLAVLVLVIAVFNGVVLADSLSDANYYDDPVKEYRADLVDAAANVAQKVTPDSANDSINKLREQLTGRSRWANDVIDAQQYWGMTVSAASTKLILAMIQVESGGNEHVDSVGNIMGVTQSIDEYNIIACGLSDANVTAGTPRASIFAGTKVTRDALNTFKEFYGYDADLTNRAQAALIAQGYNYGYRGWLGWCNDRGYTEWTLDASAAYQKARMNGGGTVNHGQKVMDALEQLG